MEKPSASMPLKVPISATKMATVQIMVERKLCRNRYTTSTTSSTASNSVSMTSSMERRTKSVVSRAMTYSMPSGMVRSNSFMTARTPLETSRPLAPGC